MAAMPLHPVLLDGALQSVMGVLAASGQIEALLPFEIGNVELAGDVGTARYAYARRVTERRQPGSAGFDVRLLDASGVELVRVDGLELRVRQFEQTPVKSDQDRFGQLEELALLRVARFLRDEGLFVKAGERYAIDTLAHSLRLAP